MWLLYVSDWTLQNSIRQNLVPEDKPEWNEKHMLHCLDYIRHQLLCSPDVTLITTDDLDEFVLTDQHKCKDFSAVVNWVERHKWQQFPEFVRGKMKQGNKVRLAWIIISIDLNVVAAHISISCSIETWVILFVICCLIDCSDLLVGSMIFTCIIPAWQGPAGLSYVNVLRYLCARVRSKPSTVSNSLSGGWVPFFFLTNAG